VSDPRCYHGVVDGAEDAPDGLPRCPACRSDQVANAHLVTCPHGVTTWGPPRFKHGDLVCALCLSERGADVTPPDGDALAAKAREGLLRFWEEQKPADPVNHPAHYTLGGVEVIDAIEAWQLGFCLGNAVKYIARAGKKDPAKTLEDLKKARWYLDREIAAQAREKPEENGA